MKIFKLFLLFVFSSVVAFATNPVQNFASNPLLENATISLLVKDLKTGQIIVQNRPKSLAITASTMKLVTTCTALEILGPDFCFETTLEIDGKITADGVLNGNLYIRGGGDPTLGSEKLGDVAFLSKWVEAVRSAGIKKIEGQIIADASLFDDEGVNPHWTWEDIGNYYASGAYGISYLDNTYKLTLKSGVEGSTPEILKITPELPELKFENYLKSTKINFDSAYFYGAPHSNFRSIRGQIPANRSEFIIKGDIPNPGLLLAKHLDLKLRESGCVISKQPTDKAIVRNSRVPIYSYKSPTLSQIITEINVQSNNHYAEHLFRYLSLKNCSVANSNDAVMTIRNFWKSKGLPVDQLKQYDGSGLSPMNAVSANFFVELLGYMKTKSANYVLFSKSLAVAGESGTLSSFLKNTSLQGKVRAKSGTISAVKCYAGYMETKGVNYAFSILVNHANGSSKDVTKKIESLLLQLSSKK